MTMPLPPVGSLAAYISVRGGAQAREDILSVQRGLTGAGKAAAGAGTALTDTEKALAATGRASISAASGANKLRAAQLGVVAATERYNAVLADENATIAQFAVAERGLILANERVAASTRAVAAAQTAGAESARAAAVATTEASASTSRFAAATGGTYRQLALMFGGFELLKKTIDIGKEAAKFQRDMLLIQTNANGSAHEVAFMTDAVLKLAPQVATSPDELAAALYHVEQNGLRGNAALMALTVGAQGAKIGLADVEDTTNTMTIALASGINGMGSMQQAMGMMIAIAGTGDMRLRDLNEALSGGILAVAKGYGATMGDVAAVLATLGDNGIRGADAATAVRMSLMAFAQPAAKGADALASVGLQMHDLRDIMEKRGLVAAMNDLERHMTSAGVTGSKVGGFLTEAFGKRAGAGLAVLMGEIDRVNIKFAEGQKGAAQFGSKWEATTQTTAFAFKKLGVEIEAGGIAIVTSAMPAVNTVAHGLGELLPAAIHTAGDALHPFAVAWHDLGAILGPVGSGLADAAGSLEPMLPLLKGVGGAALGMWVAFKGYQIAKIAITTVLDLVGALYAKAGSALAGVSLAFEGTGTAAWAASQQVALAEAEQVAAADAAEAQFARAEANKAAIVQGAADEIMAANAEEAAAAAESANAYALTAERKALASQAAALKITASAEAGAAAVVAEGEAAAIGWAGILGPLALAGVGVAVLVSMFHSSTSASKEATDAARGYAEALKSGSDSELTDSIVKQLSDNHVPETIDRLNTQMGRTVVMGPDFVSAIEKGGKPLDDLRAKLQAVIKAGTPTAAARGNIQGLLDHNGVTAATKLLADLNAQQSGLSKAAKAEIETYKHLGVAATPITKVAQNLKLGSSAAAQYAGMLGLAVTKNNNLVDASPPNIAAIAAMADQFAKATGTGTTFLGTLDSFSKSAGTAGDRAAFIGATLKAANGDALSYAAAMIGAASANNALVAGFQSDTDKIAGLRDQIAQLTSGTGKSAGANELLAAQINKTSTSISTNKERIAQLNAELGSGHVTASRAAAIHRELANAQATAAVDAARLGNQQGKLDKALSGSGASASQLAGLQKQLADAYKNSERAAINLNTGAIDFSKGGAPALVGQLQAIQDAAVKAASATYQHELATKGAKVAADDAYRLYVNQTSGALEDERKKLDLNNVQADKLGKTYFGMPKDVKTLIEQEGANPVLDVLNKIGKLLADFTGEPWNVKVNVTVQDAQLRSLAGNLKAITNPTAQGAQNKLIATVGANALGTDNWRGGPTWVGEEGRELLDLPQGSRVRTHHRSEADAAAAAGATPGMRPVHIDKFEQTINYPEPEPVSALAPRAMRMASYELGHL